MPAVATDTTSAASAVASSAPSQIDFSHTSITNTGIVIVVIATLGSTALFILIIYLYRRHAAAAKDPEDGADQYETTSKVITSPTIASEKTSISSPAPVPSHPSRPPSITPTGFFPAGRADLVPTRPAPALIRHDMEVTRNRRDVDDDSHGSQLNCIPLRLSAFKQPALSPSASEESQMSNPILNFPLPPSSSLPTGEDPKLKCTSRLSQLTRLLQTTRVDLAAGFASIPIVQVTTASLNRPKKCVLQRKIKKNTPRQLNRPMNQCLSPCPELEQ